MDVQRPLMLVYHSTPLSFIQKMSWTHRVQILRFSCISKCLQSIVDIFFTYVSGCVYIMVTISVGNPAHFPIICNTTSAS